MLSPALPDMPQTPAYAPFSPPPACFYAPPLPSAAAAMPPLLSPDAARARGATA